VDYEAIQAILVLTLLVYTWKCQQPGTLCNKHPMCISDFYTLLRVAQRCEIKSHTSLSPIQAPTEGSSTYYLSERAHEFSQFIWDRSVLTGLSWVHLKSLIFNIYITQASVQGQSAEITGRKTTLHHKRQVRSCGAQLLFLKGLK